jgi:cell division protein FtsB
LPRIATLPSANHSSKQNMSPARSRRVKWLKLRYIAVLLVWGWAGYYYWHTQYPQLHALSAKQAELEQKLQAASKQHAELLKQSQQLQDDAYIARYASEHYNLILPGQVAFNVKH